jgi:hypothetical protein
VRTSTINNRTQVVYVSNTALFGGTLGRVCGGGVGGGIFSALVTRNRFERFHAAILRNRSIIKPHGKPQRFDLRKKAEAKP